jgi:hypothetical protein
MIGRKGLEARVKRLDELGKGLSEELGIWERQLWTGIPEPLPMDTTELHRYLAAIRQVIGALGEARRTLAKVCRGRTG